MNLSEKIKIERQKKSVTQFEMADHLGMSERTYRKYEKGEIDFTLRQLVSASDYLHLNPVELLIPEIVSIKLHKKCRNKNVNIELANSNLIEKKLYIDFPTLGFILSKL